MSLPWLDRYYCKQENILIYPVPVHRVTKNGIETIYISSMNNIHDITFNVFTENVKYAYMHPRHACMRLFPFNFNEKKYENEIKKKLSTLRHVVYIV